LPFYDFDIFVSAIPSKIVVTADEMPPRSWSDCMHLKDGQALSLNIFDSKTDQFYIAVGLLRRATIVYIIKSPGAQFVR
jgi:hypothetical protein